MKNIINTHHINNYYHFLIDVLPHIIKNKEKVLVPKSLILPHFISEYDEIFNINILNFIIRSDNINISTIYNKPTLASLKILNNINVSDNIITKKRVYISRKLTKRRRIINEAIFNSLFALYNIEVIYLENYSVRQQISIFKNAELIISPHGAGLANIVFCDRKTKIIEIKRNTNIFPVEKGIIDFINCYKDLAEKLSLNYIALFSDILIPNKSSVIHHDMFISNSLFEVLKKEIQQVV